MSLRYLYKQIPADQRICSYYRCQKRILKNIDRDAQGRIWHHGCYQSAQDERYDCLNCFNRFDATEASFQEKQVVKGEYMKSSLQVACPSCGSINLRRPLWGQKRERIVE